MSRASPAPSSDGATEEGPAPPSASPEYRVRGSFTAASFAQQRAASPLTPPHEPPSTSRFLDVPYSEFSRTVLSAIDRRCIAQPLRGTVELLAPHDLMVGWLATRFATGAALAIFAVGTVCGGFLGYRWRQRRFELWSGEPGVRLPMMGSPGDDAYTSFIDCRAGTALSTASDSLEASIKDTNGLLADLEDDFDDLA